MDFILDNTGDEGFIFMPEDTGHGPMYGHGFATLFLSETYGMTKLARTCATSCPKPST